MNQCKIIRKNNGQALVEMVVSIPLLLLFAAGLVQFAILFLSYVQFEHACGEAARFYVAGNIDKNSLGPEIIDNLGRFKIYFDQSSLTVDTQQPKAEVASILEKIRSFSSKVPLVSHYDGAEWRVQIQFNPPFLLKTLFPSGVPFQTVMQVYRYPG